MRSAASEAARCVLTAISLRFGESIGEDTMQPNARWLVLAICALTAAWGCDGYTTQSGEGYQPPGWTASSGDEHGDHDHDGHGDHDDHDDDHDDHDDHDGHHHAHIVLTPELRHAAARVLLLQSTHTDRLTEVVGVVDVHADSGDQDEALDELRAVALEMGADAVVGVEFHHGETHHAPTHLSGLAVRFLDRTLRTSGE